MLFYFELRCEPFDMYCVCLEDFDLSDYLMWFLVLQTMTNMLQTMAKMLQRV